MDSFFQKLGNAVLMRWKQENFSLEKFPGIAMDELRNNPPASHVDLEKFLRAFLLDDSQPSQTESGFGEPEIIVYENPRFYIQLLFWMDGTTAIHQHEFSGAFHVMSGSSIHAQFEFENDTAITPHFRVGDLRMRGNFPARDWVHGADCFGSLLYPLPFSFGYAIDHSGRAHTA